MDPNAAKKRRSEYHRSVPSERHLPEAGREPAALTIISRELRKLELEQHRQHRRSLTSTITATMASPKNLPPVFNATAQDIEMLLSAQAHIGSKNLQVHMEPYLWKTRPDGINVINIGKTWYVDNLQHMRERRGGLAIATSFATTSATCENI